YWRFPLIGRRGCLQMGLAGAFPRLHSFDQVNSPRRLVTGAADQRATGYAPPFGSRGRKAANGSVISSFWRVNRNNAAGRPPDDVEGALSPVGSSWPRRLSTRCKFVADTSWPRAAAYSSRNCAMVKVCGAKAKPR